MESFEIDQDTIRTETLLEEIDYGTIRTKGGKSETRIVNW